MSETETKLWEHCMARGRVVLEMWPEGARAYAAPALNGLVSAAMFRDVDPEFTQALIDFARGLHALVLAQREQQEARRRARTARRADTPKPPDAARHSATEATEGIADSLAQERADGE